MKVNMVYYDTVSTFHSSHKLYETCHKVIWLRLCLIFLLSTGNHLPSNSIEWDIKIFSGSIELAKIFNHFNLLLNKMFKLLSKSWCIILSVGKIFSFLTHKQSFVFQCQYLRHLLPPGSYKNFNTILPGEYLE